MLVSTPSASAIAGSPYRPGVAPDPRFPVTEDFAVVAYCPGCNAIAQHDSQPTQEAAIIRARQLLPGAQERHAGHAPALMYVSAHQGVWLCTVANAYAPCSPASEANLTDAGERPGPPLPTTRVRQGVLAPFLPHTRPPL